MDVDWSNDEVIIYPSQEDITDMLMGQRKHIILKQVRSVNNLEKTVTIQPESPRTNNMGYYDDTLEALESAYILLKTIEINNNICNEETIEKIGNTYSHYKKQQKKYK